MPEFVGHDGAHARTDSDRRVPSMTSNAVRLRCTAWGIHPEDLPMMSIEVVEAPAIHRAVIHRIHRVLAASGDSLFHDLIDLRPTTAGERQETLSLFRRVAHFALGKSLEERLAQKHHEAF